jgi:hypothetical protein
MDLILNADIVVQWTFNKTENLDKNNYNNFID